MTMNPYLSWAIVLVVAGGLGLYYNSPKPRGRISTRATDEKTESSSSGKKQKRKAKRTVEPSSPTDRIIGDAAPVSKSPLTDNPAENIDSKEMAKRLATGKNGSFQPGSGSAKPQKNNRGNKRTAGQLEGGSSGHGSSTTGADADDDLSSTGSPDMSSSARNVSDMLEATGPGASVLRVTGLVESEPKRQKVQSSKPAETKKQRQQRARNEARKAQVQEAEEQRRKLLEKQLHTARELERREAVKSQPAVVTNAWQGKAKENATNGVLKTAPNPAVDLLDTFGDDVSPGNLSTTQESKELTRNLPLKDEPIRIFGSTNGLDEWTTVSSKNKKAKKTGRVEESASEASASENQTAQAPTSTQHKVTVSPTYLPDILRSQQKGHPLDSDWAA